MNESDKLRFLLAARECLSAEHARISIGTYKEKRLHSVLKHFYEPVETYHEVKCGAYIADILRKNEIIEIQTGSFYPMKDKIKFYLENTDKTVNVVRPLPYIKWCCWINKYDGSVVSRNKSPKKTLPQDIMRDLVFLSDFIRNPKFRITFLLLEVEEYRFLDGWSRDKKRGSSRYEFIPISLVDEDVYSSPEDYRRFLPVTLSDTFTAKEYLEKTRFRSLNGYAALGVLCGAGLIEKSEKQGRSYVYKKK